jgi:hypothetical protein
LGRALAPKCLTPGQGERIERGGGAPKMDGRGDSDSARCGDSDESVARRAGEPAGQGEYVLGESGWVEDLELGTEDGHVDGEHVR